MKRIILFLFFVILLSSLCIAEPQIGQLKVTMEHPFYVNGEWVPFHELRVGDILRTHDGKKARITSLDYLEVEEPVNVYNIEVSFPNDYFAEGILVHNKDVGPEFRPRDTPWGGFLDEDDAIRLVGEDPSEVAFSRGIRIGGVSGGAREVVIDGKKYVVKHFDTPNVKSELANRFFIDSMKRHNRDAIVRTSTAVGYEKCSKTKSGVLVDHFVEGSYGLNQYGGDTVKQMSGFYTNEGLAKARADLRIMKNVLGLSDINYGNYLMLKGTKGGVPVERIYLIDMEYTGNLVGKQELDYFIKMYRMGYEPSWSVVKELNTPEFKNTLLERTQWYKDNKGLLKNIYKTSLEKAGFSKKDVAKKVKNVGKNIDKLQNNIQKEWNLLEQNGYTTTSP